MPFNGTGMFVRVRNWVADAAAGVKIRADYHDIEDDGFADGLGHCITKDGQTTITQNIPFNSKRITSLSDPVDPQDAATKAYADLKLPLTGGTITGNLNVTGSIGAIGYKTRPGVAGPFGANVFNFNWTGNLEAWVDNTKVGALATQAYVEQRAQDWAVYYTNPKVNRAGDTITGSLAVNGSLIAAGSSAIFLGPSAGGYIQWQGGGTYVFGGGGIAWHSGNLATPVRDGRLVNAGQINIPADGQVTEPYSGAVISGLIRDPSNGYPMTGARWRYVQLLTSGWYTVGYV